MLRKKRNKTMANTKTVRLKQKIRWLCADTETPISLYMKTAGDSDGILLESAEVDGKWGRFSILATDMLFYVSCKNGLLELDIRDPEFEPLKIHQGRPFVDGLRGLMNDIDIESEGGAKLPPITRALYGYFGFGMVSVFNPRLADRLPLSEAECRLAMPASVLVFDHLYNRLCQLSIKEHKQIEYPGKEGQNGQKKPQMKDIRAEPGEEGYKDTARKIKSLLAEGEAIQVVPSTRFSMPFCGNAFNLYRKLRRLNASPYLFYMHFPEITLFGSSPEVMVRCQDGALQLSPIAGTRKRGKTDKEDAELANELLQDPKDRAEHVMLVDLGRNDLGKIAKPGSVCVEKYMEVERFSHVMHLTSRIAAMLLKKDASGRRMDCLDVLAAAFPAGTVSGAPKFRAMEIIRDMEKTARGPYAGCIGWLGLDKDSVNLDTGITIRSMWVKDGRLYWQAGGGIVHDSCPDAEWQEVCNKSAIMRLVLQEEDDGYVPADR